MRLCVFVILVCFSLPLLAQSDLLYVDKEGVLRRKSDQQEQSFFGVNYTLPFAYAYRHVKAMGLNPEQVIDADVYHFARLGLDAFRVHVWDTEISDAEGNLLNNEHLRLFDYLIKKLKERNIRILITPIAYWGNGYPDRNEETQGFSNKFRYNKKKLVTNDTAIAAQENYIKQLLLHVNPYTKLSYRDDPGIIACEINNEPDHGEDNKQTTAYINRMADAVRSINWKKPVFYNISQAYRNEEAFLAARVDGFTYQWYSNGLVANHTTPGNTLPYVDNYAIPYKDWPGFADKAKIIYEFDAADVRSSYMYPAMARSFRTAGFQWATQFAWDPTPLAYANTEYQTHYLNLAYTPAKAISFMIAGKAFHRVPRFKTYGGFPADTSFEQFRVSYKEDLSELNSGTEFYYSNNTNTKPVTPSKLQHIAGVGNSPLVSYSGTGAYFLDRVAPGVWRLELMPDAVGMKDPFTSAALNDTATYIVWKQQNMQVQLPDLGKRFRIMPLNQDNKNKSLSTTDGRFTAGPGVYLLSAKEVNPATLKLHSLPLGMREFYAPPSMQLPAVKVFAEPPREFPAGQDLPVSATVLSLPEGEELELQVNSNFLPLTKQTVYNYAAIIPASMVDEGELRLAIRLKKSGYVVQNLRSVRVLDQTARLELFNARKVQEDTVLKSWWRIKNFPDWNRRTHYKFDTSENGVVSYKASADTFNFDIPFIGWQYSCNMTDITLQGENIYSTIKLTGAPANGKAASIRLILVDHNGNAYGRNLTLEGTSKTYELSISSFSKSPFLLIPRPYPMFLPLWFNSTVYPPLQLPSIEKIQVLYMPEENEKAEKEKGYLIEAIWGAKD
ncbi:membrane or secreted protein [Pseudobacter ginsenosidimutans]|uniref:Cellulase (Glycosyl hydrolase family 5) n=1 Tax=Pseudobacter ginsenosidimutans TaxID=661488 RepID=A0A4Q7N200_9BACT|nr:membrane or secreted protein [Pseudobacter ginsenosidimutans]QEC44026.1 membrane or secreted protein [Pseudobacter ginsenosidimutans]RZS75463.1 hypothetical protein EV199_1329 [Pseudobacter ginsenosidimutans]